MTSVEVMFVSDPLARFSAAALHNPCHAWPGSAIEACRELDRRHAGMWRWAVLEAGALTVWRLSGNAEYVAGHGPLGDDDLAASEAMLSVENRSIVGVDRNARKLMVDRLPRGLVALRDALAMYSAQPAYYMPIRAVVDGKGRALAAVGVALSASTVLDVDGVPWCVSPDGVLYADWMCAPPALLAPASLEARYPGGSLPLVPCDGVTAGQH